LDNSLFELVFFSDEIVIVQDFKFLIDTK
jgi:hypothetical protein